MNIHIAAWLKYAILPGVYAFKTGIDEFLVYAAKALLTGNIIELKKRLLYFTVYKNLFFAYAMGFATTQPISI